jgi:predicted Zn finger-like uncharacterized protein
MSDVTRCPHCGTAFRVQPAQLTARAGKVRCGYCLEVFDGAACLVGQAGDSDSSGFPADAPAAAGANLPAPAQPEPSAQAGAAAAEVPEFLAPEKPRVRYTLLWGFLALLALIALAAQITYRYRTEIATTFPESRAHLVAACAAFGCEVRLPRRPDLLSIESSDLQADPRRENVLRLSALLRNRAAFAQEPPSLELTLTDENDRAMVRRVLSPIDYLGANRAAELDERGIPAGAEVAVVVNFDASRTRATGYRLYLFHP